jgi:hypothetical protein
MQGCLFVCSFILKLVCAVIWLLVGEKDLLNFLEMW